MEQYLILPQDLFSIPANTVVGPVFGTSPVLDFSALPGSLVCPRLLGRVATADSGSHAQLNVRIITPSSGGDSVDRSDTITIPNVGLVSVAGPTYSKPSGIKRVNCTAQMDTAGKAGSTEDMLLALDLVDADSQKLWTFWQPSNVNWVFNNFPPSESLGGVVGYFDFSQIPLGATVHIALAGMAVQFVGDFKVRIADIANYNDLTGTVVLTGSMVGSGGGSGNPCSAAGTFVNTFSGLKVIKVTGIDSFAGGVSNSNSVVMWY